MASKKKDGLKDALGSLSKALNAFGQPWMMIGGLAVVAHGHARMTQDLDVNVEVPIEDAEKLFSLLKKHRISGRIKNAPSFFKQHHVLLCQHTPSGIHIDLALAALPFQLEALRRARNMTLFGVPVRVISPTDLIVTKMVAHRPVDLDDVDRILLLHSTEIDVVRVRRHLKAFSNVLEMPELRSVFNMKWKQMRHMEKQR